MSIKEIRESALLEYYALGLLSVDEQADVHRILDEYPILRQDLYEIQRSIQAYAKTHGVVPKRDLHPDIVDLIRKEGDKSPVSPDQAKTDMTTTNPSSGIWKGLLAALLGLAAVCSLWYASTVGAQLDALQSEVATVQTECDSISGELSRRLALYEMINDASTRTLNLTPTDAYQETNLLFHINENVRRNFIQIKKLPEIAGDQTFQLWALKDGVDPIPLSTFDGGGDMIVPVDYEEGTGTYAITIEDQGGAQVPTLSRLIGTVGV